MKSVIEISAKGKKYSIPNSWNLLSKDAYLALMEDLVLFSSGRLSVGQVKVNYVARTLGIRIDKVHDDADLANIVWMAEQVTFIFLVCYPDNDAALKDLSTEDKDKYKRLSPEHIGGALARYLRTQNYKYTLDGLFCSQLLPEIKVGRATYKGYSINSDFGALTSSLVAQQWLEARRISSSPQMSKEKLSLLAGILYCPIPYNIDQAKQLAKKMFKLELAVLEAIAFNFNSFNNFIFRKTEFSILAEGKATRKAITVDADAKLYDLSGYGLGSSSEVEQLNLITYLTILRNKLIESVRSLYGAKMKITDIATETGLPLPIINDII